MFLLLAAGRLGDTPGFEVMTGLAVDLLATAEQVLLPRHLEHERLLDTFIGGDVLDLHPLAAFDGDVGIDPERALLLGIEDTEVLERCTELV